MQVCDAITADNFQPETMGEYGINWELLGLWDADTGESLMPFLAETFTAYLAPVVTTDEEGNVLSTSPATLHEPHRWAGHAPREGLTQ
jgi:hypothetical protein